MKKSNSLKLLTSKTPKVYKSKKLNNANFGDFTLNDHQVLLYLISKMGGVDEFGKYLQPEQLQKDHVLTSKEFCEIFNTGLSNSYKILRKACKKLMKTSIVLENFESTELREINICAEATYKKKEGMIEVKFTDSIMPFLAQTKRRFVLYNLKEIANFGSLYTTRLYELIQEFKETGWMLRSIDQLRCIFAVGNKLKSYKDFKQNTFAHACQEINDNYNMDLRFEEIKEGRKVVAVKFFFKQVKVLQVLNPKTGLTSNVYTKPKIKIKSDLSRNTIKKIEPKLAEVLEGQLSFDNLKKEEVKPIKNIFSSFLYKFSALKKKQ